MQEAKVDYRLRRFQRVYRKYETRLRLTKGVLDLDCTPHGIFALVGSDHDWVPGRLDGVPIILVDFEYPVCGCQECQKTQAESAAERAARWCN